MFSRSRSEADGEPQADPPIESTGDEAARAFDQVLSDLQPPGSAPTEPDVAAVAADAEEHAATLRATRDAHREAQAMLAVASQSRQEASEEAERIVLEARDAAERTRQELAGWAAAQRAKVDALAADLAESARRDADTLRAEALRTSMAEAEETARHYVAEAAEGAQRDADGIRAEARLVLERATAIGEDITSAIEDLSSAADAVTARLEVARAAMAQLLEENPAPEPDEDAEDESSPDGSDAEPAEAAGAEEPDPTREAETGQPEDVADLRDPDGAGAPTDQEELPAQDDAGERAGAADGRDDRTDRQLGSMFRRQGHHGRGNDQ